MTRNGGNINELTPKLDDGEWLYQLLAPVRERIREHPSPLAMRRVRQRIWPEITRKSLAAA